jgi:uncharacterized protein
MPDPGAANPFYSARPLLQVNGEDEAGLSDGLLSLMVEETTEGLFRCEATLGNWGSRGSTVDFLYFDRSLLDFGRDFAVTAGSGEAEARLFDGRISGIEAHFPQDRPSEVTILAEDRFQDLRMTRRTRTFEDVTVRDVIDRIASAHSLRSDMDIEGPTYRVLAQVNQSDLAFLRECARSIDAEVWIEGRTLFAQSRGRRNRGEVTITHGQGLREFSVLADLSTQCTTLTVSGWDVETKQGVSHEASEQAIRSEINGSLGGASVLQSAFGARSEHVVHLVPFSQDESRSAAEARFRSRARRFVTGSGVAEGDGRLRVGTHVIINGVGALFTGRYYVSEVRHTFDVEQGFRTAFRVERPGINAS